MDATSTEPQQTAELSEPSGPAELCAACRDAREGRAGPSPDAELVFAAGLGHLGCMRATQSASPLAAELALCVAARAGRVRAGLAGAMALAREWGAADFGRALANAEVGHAWGAADFCRELANATSY
jgi:hypothetical protein